MEEKQHINTPLAIKEHDIRGEKIIFDLLIKQKLAHVIVIKAGPAYHINLDGEDLGYFHKEDGKVTRYEQPRGAADDADEYFKAVEAKLEELGK